MGVPARTLGMGYSTSGNTLVSLHGVQKKTANGPDTVTLSHSEGSVPTGREMLRCAQHDKAVIPTHTRSILFICIIAPYISLIDDVSVIYAEHSV